MWWMKSCSCWQTLTLGQRGSSSLLPGITPGSGSESRSGSCSWELKQKSSLRSVRVKHHDMFHLVSLEQHFCILCPIPCPLFTTGLSEPRHVLDLVASRGARTCSGNNGKWLFGVRVLEVIALRSRSWEDEGPFKCCMDGGNTLRNPPWDTSNPLPCLRFVSTVGSPYELSHLKTWVNQGSDKTTVTVFWPWLVCFLLLCFVFSKLHHYYFFYKGPDNLRSSL